ncbi:MULTISPECIES: class I SAM-dependent methyltransferase [unclassified Bradyrhizobium]|uniref:class I SAM-dependent methyltransferase n=1 Tax=unclassified Bradyrhizobium TaxID=2631580 RepID=UPI0028E4C56C|nr:MULTISPECIES: class I SAM-dependent methyltransferase [unclassified Bradyrhizobium]
MIDLNDLVPSEMARLLGKPEGESGRAVANMLNRINAGITAAVYERLQLKPGERVLEVGFGNGKLLPNLLSRADHLTYEGVDIAETMVADANAFNADLVAAGRAAFRLASAETLPFPDQTFDKVFAVNVIYFWPRPLRALSEIRRVLRPDGLSCIASAVSVPGEPPPAFARPEFGFYRRDLEAILALHREAGFDHVEVDDHYRESITLPDRADRKRNYVIVLAQPKIPSQSSA